MGEMELMVKHAGTAALSCATMMPDKCTAPEGLTMAARWQDTVHGHMATARQCAALTAITMLENSTATWEWMIMIAGLVTSALQKNAQQEHTEDKIVVLRKQNLISQPIFKIRSFIKIPFL